MRKIYLFILPGLVTTLAAAAQDSVKVTLLQEVVISATRSEQPVIEIPRSVTVIREDEIKNSVYQSVGDLLNARSGLFVVGANQTPGTNQNLFMRGMNSNQVAVLIDGVRITDPSTPNAAIDLSEVSLINIERIEIIRGSHSTIFGGAAVGGVINIITKKKADPGFHGDISWQGGVFGKDAWSSTEGLDLNYGNNGGIYFNGSLFQQDVSGLDASAPSQSAPFFTSDRDDFQKTDVSLKAGLKREKLRGSISFRNAHQYTEIDDGAFADDENNYLEFDRQLFQYDAGYQLRAAMSLTLVGSFSDSRRFFEDDSSRVSPSTWDHVFSTGTYHGRLQTHELQFNYKKKQLQGVFGAGLYREKMFFDNYLLFNDPSFPFELVTNYDTIDARTSTGYVFAQLDYRLSNLSFSGGGRLSRHTTAGHFATFDFNPSWSVNDLLVYGSLSTGFNTPSLYQLYDPSRNFGAYATRGNRDLKPEASLSLEVGVKRQFSSGSYLTVSAYQTRVNNAIEYVYLWNSQRPIAELDFADDRGDRYINIAEQNVKGIEFEGFVQVSPSVFFQGNVSMLEAEIMASPADINTKHTGGNHVQLYNLGSFLTSDLQEEQVVRRPGLTAFFRLNYNPIRDVSLHAIYRYTGKRFDAGYDGSLGPYGSLARIEVDAYHLIDFGVNWNATEYLSVAVKVENILDEDYREVVGFQTRGRSAYLKLTGRF